jgi:hypothetical protein
VSLASAAAAEQLLTFLGTALNSKHAGYDSIMMMMMMTTTIMMIVMMMMMI